MRVFSGMLLIIIGSVMANMESIPYHIVSDTANKISGCFLIIGGVMRIKADSKPVKIGVEGPVLETLKFIIVIVLIATIAMINRLYFS